MRWRKGYGGQQKEGDKRREKEERGGEKGADSLGLLSVL